MPTAVVLSMCTGVAGCGWPNSCNVSRSIFACCALRNSAPNSASAADATTSFRMEHVMCIFPFRRIGCLFLGRLPRKKYPPARLLAFPADKYDASECTLTA